MGYWSTVKCVPSTAEGGGHGENYLNNLRRLASLVVSVSQLHI